MHKNARLTPQGQLLLVQRITDQGWTVGSAAGAAGLSERQAYRWLARYRGGGSAALTDRSSAPQHRPHQVPAARVAEIERRRASARASWCRCGSARPAARAGSARQRLRSGPAIARQLAMPVSTVGGILRRLGLGKLSAHGLPAGTTPPLRNPPQSAGPRQRVLSCLSTIFLLRSCKDNIKFSMRPVFILQPMKEGLHIHVNIMQASPQEHRPALVLIREKQDS